MKTKEEILKILSQEMPFLKERYQVLHCGLFGSYAYGQTSPKSDIDILVQFEKPVGFFKFIELEDYLSEKLGIKVDLVTEEALKPLIKPHVMERVIYV
jgi:predicted nucleotidyltransferase